MKVVYDKNYYRCAQLHGPRLKWFWVKNTMYYENHATKLCMMCIPLSLVQHWFITELYAMWHIIKLCVVIIPPRCVWCGGENNSISLCDLNLKLAQHVYKVHRINDIRDVTCFHQMFDMSSYIIGYESSRMMLIGKLGIICWITRMGIWNVGKTFETPHG